MFIFIVQLADLLAYGWVQLFLVFFVSAWALYLFRLYQSSKYTGIIKNPILKSVSVIIPVVDEPRVIWQLVLDFVKKAVKDLDAEIIIVPNGQYSQENAEIADSYGFKVIKIDKASKRTAIYYGAMAATKEIVIILDSDTIVTQNAIKTLVRGFVNDNIGGIVPRQEAYNHTTIFERLCDWYEDIRFYNTTRGLSFHRQVPCLIGRLFAIRRELLMSYLPKFTNQKLFGIRMETGDDRVLTGYLLEGGFETLYEDTALVYTIVPQTLKKFIKQRTRWARSSFRETILSRDWILRYPYAFTIFVGDIVVRWLFFAVVVWFFWKLFTGFETHYFDLSLKEYVIGSIAGFFLSGYIKHIPHLRRKPQDFWITPLFLLLNTFILTPIEWYGNLTFWKQGWLTRKIN